MQNLMTKHIAIYDKKTIIEILLPDGRYIYRAFNPNHKLIESITWRL